MCNSQLRYVDFLFNLDIEGCHKYGFMMICNVLSYGLALEWTKSNKNPIYAQNYFHYYLCDAVKILVAILIECKNVQNTLTKKKK